MIKKKHNIIYGKNAVLEALKASKRKITKILISNYAQGKVISDILHIAKSKNISVQKIDMKLKRNVLYKKAQGIIAKIESVQYISLIQLIKNVKVISQYPILIISDGITDPHNLGAIIRNCVAFRVHGIILPNRRNVDINETVAKVSTGAVEHIYVSKVVNINYAIKILKQNGFFIIGTALGTDQPISKIRLNCPIVIILGNEQHGMHNLTKKYCDMLVSITHCNKVASLNVSCALAIILYEISRSQTIKLL